VEGEYCYSVRELLAALEHRQFDLAVVYLRGFSPSPTQAFAFNDPREILLQIDRIPHEWCVTNSAPWTISFLRRIHRTPVLVYTLSGEVGFGPLCKEAGADFFLSPSDMGGGRKFTEVVSTVLLAATQPRRTDPSRVVLVDDDDCFLEIVGGLIRDWLKDLTLLSFQDGETAWQELLRTDPDLLITDIAHPGINGLEMLSLLAERKVKYPILVTSGNPLEKEVFRCAGPDLKVSFLQKSYSADEFCRQLLIHLGPSDNPKWQRRKDSL
jgi:CheY-like chemotaxis protein